MIPAVAQTLANILAVGTSITGLEQISLSAPDTVSVPKTGLNLYLYDVRPSHMGRSPDPTIPWTPDSQSSGLEPSIRFQSQVLGSRTLRSADDCSAGSWLDVSFVITVQNQTSLGMQALLSEALLALMQHPSIPEELIVPPLNGCEPLALSLHSPPDIASFWSALQLPLRPAIFVIVTVPLNRDRASIF